MRTASLGPPPGLTAPIGATPARSAPRSFGFELSTLAGLDVEVLTPNGTGGLRGHLARIAKAELFGDRAEVLARAAAASSITATPLVRDARPVVGVLVSDPAALLPGGARSLEAVVAQLKALGARPLLIPPCIDRALPRDREGQRAGYAAIARALDGLVGPGGDDVHPWIYGQRNRHSVETNFPRDRAEAALVRAALEADLFFLGICRSHQLANAASGGSLVQDVRKDGYSAISQNQDDFDLPEDAPFVLRDPRGRIQFENRVLLETDSQLAAILSHHAVVTNSFHHQAVERPGRGLRVVGTVHDPVTRRRTIEATEGRNAITVQWHPELIRDGAPDRALMEVLVRRANVFRLWRGLGPDRDFSALLGLLRDRPRLGLTSADWSWIHGPLAERFGSAETPAAGRR